MPYSNIPKELWGKMESCTSDLKNKGKIKNVYAVCYASILGKRANKK